MLFGAPEIAECSSCSVITAPSERSCIDDRLVWFGWASFLLQKACPLMATLEHRWPVGFLTSSQTGGLYPDSGVALYENHLSYDLRQTYRKE
jgi:hypothetical protein